MCYDPICNTPPHQLVVKLSWGFRFCISDSQAEWSCSAIYMVRQDGEFTVFRVFFFFLVATGIKSNGKNYPNKGFFVPDCFKTRFFIRIYSLQNEAQKCKSSPRTLPSAFLWAFQETHKALIFQGPSGHKLQSTLIYENKWHQPTPRHFEMGELGRAIKHELNKNIQTP
jgi:hypothetical protein